MDVARPVTQRPGDDAVGQAHHRTVVDDDILGELVVLLGLDRVQQPAGLRVQAARPLQCRREGGRGRDDRLDTPDSDAHADVVERDDVRRVGAGDQEGVAVAGQWDDAVALCDLLGDQADDVVGDDEAGSLDVLELELRGEGAGDVTLGGEPQPDDGLSEAFAAPLLGVALVERPLQLRRRQDLAVDEDLAELLRPLPAGERAPGVDL